MSILLNFKKTATDKWRKEQEKKLWLVICMAFHEEPNKKKRRRMRKCYQIFKKKLLNIQNIEWVPYIACLPDWAVVYEIDDKELWKDLYLVRNKAIYTCYLWNIKLF